MTSLDGQREARCSRYTSQPAYALLTAARNEGAFIGETIRSVVNQTVRPLRWVIVNDASTDDTQSVIDHFAKSHTFIQPLTTATSGKPGFGSKVNAIRWAYQHIEAERFDLLGILDADVVLPPDYYKRLTEWFAADTALGLAGGSIVEESGDAIRPRRSNRTFSVPGAIQMFRRNIYDSIGGLHPQEFGGEDWLAEIQVRSRGWRVASDPSMEVLHCRPLQSGARPLKRMFQQGRMDAVFGSAWIFEIGKCIKRVSERPICTGSIARFLGYVWAIIAHSNDKIPIECALFLRNEQRLRLQDTFNRFGRRSSGRTKGRHEPSPGSPAHS